MSKTESVGPEAYYSSPPEKILGILHTRPDGLSEDETRSGLARYGPNEIREAHDKPLSHRFAVNLTPPNAGCWNMRRVMVSMFWRPLSFKHALQGDLDFNG